LETDVSNDGNSKSISLCERLLLLADMTAAIDVSVSKFSESIRRIHLPYCVVYWFMFSALRWSPSTVKIYSVVPSQVKLVGWFKDVHLIPKLDDSHVSLKPCNFFQWLFQPIQGPTFLFSSEIIFTVGRTSDQLVARPLPKHRTTQTQNKRIHTPNIHDLSGIRTHDPSV
jgi:hypothetical protein